MAHSPFIEVDPPRSDPNYAVTVGRAPLQREVRLPPAGSTTSRGRCSASSR
ncbi:MAG: hypothetical protein IPI16_11885 [Comamonadaceae bacterium]|nr:hypothetical protein [Comamonadaceae bacterium]